MYIHHSLEEKKEIIRLHASGASMSELMKHYHVHDHYLYILFSRYEKYGMDGLENFKKRRITNTLKQSVIEEYKKDSLLCGVFVLSMTQFFQRMPLVATVQAWRL